VTADGAMLAAGLSSSCASTIKRPAWNTRAGRFHRYPLAPGPLCDEHNQDDAEDEHREPSAGNTMEFSISHLQAVVAHALQQLAKQANSSGCDANLSVRFRTDGPSAFRASLVKSPVPKVARFGSRSQAAASPTRSSSRSPDPATPSARGQARRHLPQRRAGTRLS
jgi:hypothetical protein